MTTTRAERITAAEMAKRYTEDGWTLRACARAAGVGDRVAKRMLARQGVTLRTPAGGGRKRRESHSAVSGCDEP